MSSTTTVAEFAAELNKPTATLIEQLTNAGELDVEISALCQLEDLRD